RTPARPRDSNSARNTGSTRTSIDDAIDDSFCEDAVSPEIIVITLYPQCLSRERVVAHQQIEHHVRVADEAFHLFPAASAQWWIAAREGSREYRLQRRRDVDDEVRHGHQAAERLDILTTRGMVDVDEDVVGGMDRALVHQHGLPAVRLAGQDGVDAELPQHASARTQRGDGPVGVASYHGHGEGQEVAVSAEGDRLPHAPEVEREVLERRVAADRARKPGQRDVLGGGDRQATAGTLAPALLHEARRAAPRAAGDFNDHDDAFRLTAPGRAVWEARPESRSASPSVACPARRPVTCTARPLGGRAAEEALATAPA